MKKIQIATIILIIFIAYSLAQLTGNVVKQQLILSKAMNTTYYKLFSKQFNTSLKFLGVCNVTELKEKWNWKGETYWCVVFTNANESMFAEFIISDDGNIMYQHIGEKRIVSS